MPNATENSTFIGASVSHETKARLEKLRLAVAEKEGKIPSASKVIAHVLAAGLEVVEKLYGSPAVTTVEPKRKRK